MLRTSLRDPRVSKAVQVAFVAMSALWLVNFSTQETHSTLSWVLLPLNIAVLVGFLFLLLRDIWKPHRVEAHRLTNIRCFATKAEPRERRAIILVTKMVANRSPRAGIERDGTAVRYFQSSLAPANASSDPGKVTGQRWPQHSMSGPFRQVYLDVKGE
jgi:hypothetical protein